MDFDKFDENQLTESARNAQRVSVGIGDACADYATKEVAQGRDPVLVFGEMIAGLMAAAACIQSVTKRDPRVIAAEFELGVRVAGMASPTDCLGEKLRDAIGLLSDKSADKPDKKPNVPPAPGMN